MYVFGVSGIHTSRKWEKMAGWESPSIAHLIYEGTLRGTQPP